MLAAPISSKRERDEHVAIIRSVANGWILQIAHATRLKDRPTMSGVRVPRTIAFGIFDSSKVDIFDVRLSGVHPNLL